MFTLNAVVPWGRSFDEYCRMFALTDEDLDGRILGCGDGPASFNSEAARRGHRVVSVDPLYRFDRAQIHGRIVTTYEEVLAQTRRNEHEFVWGAGIRNVEELGRVRMTAMQAFLDDFDAGRRDGRYIVAELPHLPFAQSSFSLAVCSHLLFLYSSQLGEAFHRAAIREMCRVATEVRVFPLLALGAQRSPFVEGCVRDRENSGYRVTIETVAYEFQRGGNQMMRIARRTND